MIRDPTISLFLLESVSVVAKDIDHLAKTLFQPAALLKKIVTSHREMTRWQCRYDGQKIRENAVRSLGLVIL